MSTQSSSVYAVYDRFKLDYIIILKADFVMHIPYIILMLYSDHEPTCTSLQLCITECVYAYTFITASSSPTLTTGTLIGTGTIPIHTHLTISYKNYRALQCITGVSDGF